MDVVSSYKYLGIIFSIKLKWTLAKKTLAAQARKAIGLIFRYHYQCGNLPVGAAKILFDKMITPILLYGCDVWGWEYCDQIENVQFYFYKRKLGLGSHTSHTAVTGELGIYPLAVIYYKRCVKCWLKIFKMSGDRLPHACYEMLKGLDDCNRVTWASNIKMLLCKFGFEYVWNAQGVQDENAFLCVFEDRVKQHFATLWRN